MSSVSNRRRSRKHTMKVAADGDSDLSNGAATNGNWSKGPARSSGLQVLQLGSGPDAKAAAEGHKEGLKVGFY